MTIISQKGRSGKPIFLSEWKRMKSLYNQSFSQCILKTAKYDMNFMINSHSIEQSLECVLADIVLYTK